jgi:hypothetical protein
MCLESGCELILAVPEGPFCRGNEATVNRGLSYLGSSGGRSCTWMDSLIQLGEFICD